MSTKPAAHKWARPPQSRTVSFYHRRVAELFAARIAASGRRWEDAVWDDSLALTAADYQALEDELLASGLRFQMSAGISIAEAPEKYEQAVAAGGLDDVQPDAQGRRLAGHGDNVFHVATDIIGTARFIRSVDIVMDMLDHGVPPDTIAVIDDSGGTLTAPILEGFKAVVCKGGSVRSHLGILTREYRIPCLMNAEVRGLAEGDRVQVEYSVAAKPPYEDADGTGRARVWKLPAEAGR
ncbi:MAG: PEP-utilizing enzyme [Gammaproteobacteria bacterium]